MQKNSRQAVGNRMRQDGPPGTMVLDEISLLEFGDTPVNFLRCPFDHRTEMDQLCRVTRRDILALERMHESACLGDQIQ